MPEYEVIEFARTQLTLPDKLDPADEMSWQHYLYSKLGKKEQIVQDTLEKSDKKPENKIEDTVERIVAMAKVLYGLHMVSVRITQYPWPSTSSYRQHTRKPYPSSPSSTDHIKSLYVF